MRDMVKVGSLGKVKTALQMISIILLLLVNPGGKNVEADVVSGLWKAQEEKKKVLLMAAGMTALVASAIAAVVSGVQYFAAAVPLLLAPSTTNTDTNTTTDTDTTNTDTTTTTTNTTAAITSILSENIENNNQ